MFKIYKSDVSKPIYILFRKNNSYHSYNTRKSDNLHTPVGRTEAMYKTFSFYRVHIWNHISSNIQTDVSYTSFKCKVKTYIQNNNITICVASLQKGPHVAKNKKIKFLLILIEQVMTNLLKKNSVLAQIFTKLWSIYELHNYIILIIILNIIM